MSEEGPAWDSAAEALLTGNDPVWNSPERPSNEDVDEQTQGQRGMGYLEYCENIQEEGGAFYQIGSDLFVVNGWDPQRKISKASWFHVQRTTIARNVSTNSFFAITATNCFPWTPVSPAVLQMPCCFSRQELDEGVFTNHFSSPSPNSRSLNGRVIVVYTGDDTGTGQWLCMKDSSNQGCWHISTCRDLLQKLIRVDPAATDETVVDGSSIDYSVPRATTGGPSAAGGVLSADFSTALGVSVDRPSII
ncbi:CxC4 domain-containing protein [Mycena sanguinolenta]|uniref:CxC4 domain-containing protein n=1 Tax=Mycena sanguinolenta TaxID=230812 RepID=A0A8H6YMR7_9AGAR|nr:CxC4 domain-containing protein [Mycena sanguinolenta]